MDGKGRGCAELEDSDVCFVLLINVSTSMYSLISQSLTHWKSTGQKPGYVRTRDLQIFCLVEEDMR